MGTRIERRDDDLETVLSPWVDGKAVKGSLLSAMQLDGEDVKYLSAYILFSGFAFDFELLKQ